MREIALQYALALCKQKAIPHEIVEKVLHVLSLYAASSRFQIHMHALGEYEKITAKICAMLVELGFSEKTLHSLVFLFVKNKRLTMLGEIYRLFVNLRAEQGNSRVKITFASEAAAELAQTELVSFVDGFLGTQSEITTEIEKEIIGGFVVRVRNTVIDASIRNKIQRYKTLTI